MTDTVTIGIVGTGFGASVQLPAFQRVRGCTVAGITSRQYDRVQEITAKTGIKPYASWQEMLADPKIQAVSIATPPRAHREICLAALQAGKAILCEKPFCMNAAEAREVEAAAAMSGLTCMINFEFPLHPLFQMLAERVNDEKAAGPLRAVHVRWILGSWADPKRVWSWQCDQDLGGGILSSIGVHALDYIERMFGRITALSANAGIGVKERSDGQGGMRACTAIDHCDLLLQLEGGVQATCSLSNVTPRGDGHTVTVHGHNRSWQLSSEVVQDYGRGFRLREGRLSDVAWTDITPEGIEPAPGEDGRIKTTEALVETFIEAVRAGNGSAEPSFRAGVRTRVLLEAIDEAIATKAWVKIAA